MLLQEAMNLAADLSNISITLLSSETEFRSFANRCQFHAVQEYLDPELLKQMRNSRHHDIMCTVDLFQIHIIFCSLPEGVLALGPYCTELFTRSDRMIILNRLHLPEELETDLDAYRSSFPVTKESTVLHILHAIGRSMGWIQEQERIYSVDFRDIELPQDRQEENLQIDYREMIHQRYLTEHEFMNNIRAGRQNAAIQNWKELHRSVSYLKNLGHTMEVSKMAAAVFRTTIRIAADEVGMSSYINDQLSHHSSKIIQNAKTIDEIDREHERLIKDYCRAIRRQKEENYSNLVISIMYQLEHMYAEDVTISSLAGELSISKNHMITAFRKETGTTPIAYLNNVRMEKAAEQLTSTRKPIQDISISVGIMDNNYFTKMFKKEYGQTPSEYRKSHSL